MESKFFCFVNLKFGSSHVSLLHFWFEKGQFLWFKYQKFPQWNKYLFLLLHMYLVAYYNEYFGISDVIIFVVADFKLGFLLKQEHFFYQYDNNFLFPSNSVCFIIIFSFSLGAFTNWKYFVHFWLPTHPMLT